MIRAQRSTGLIALGFSIFVSTIPTHAQLIKSPADRAASLRSAAGPTQATAAGSGPSQQPATSARRISISDAVSIFLNQNFQLIAARYDIDTVEAEKLTARLRPNPDVSVGFSGL